MRRLWLCVAVCAGCSQQPNDAALFKDVEAVVARIDSCRDAKAVSRLGDEISYQLNLVEPKLKTPAARDIYAKFLGVASELSQLTLRELMTKDRRDYDLLSDQNRAWLRTIHNKGRDVRKCLYE